MTESQAREILSGYLQPDGSIYSLGAYISWSSGSPLVIDNDPYALSLTPEFLRALAWWIENH
jgi:hypothetical protein